MSMPDRSVNQNRQATVAVSGAAAAHRLELALEGADGAAPSCPAGQREAAGVTLRASGGLDFNTVIAFRDAAFAAVGGKPARLTLDLSALNYCDTAGLNGLLAVVRVGRLMGVPVRVTPAPELRATLESTGLSHQIPLAA
jgi:anti-anti-sigma factor